MLLSNFDNTFRHIQSISDQIRRDVERTLQRSFQTWDVLEHTLPIDDNAYYKMKIRVDDNGHVKVKTAQKEPGKDWEVHVEEYNRGKAIADDSRKMLEQDKDRGDRKMIKAPHETLATKSDNSNLAKKPDTHSRVGGSNPVRDRELAHIDSLFNTKFQSIADSIKKDVESMLDRTFKVFDVFEHSTSSSNKDDKKDYNMKIKVDDEGHV